MKKLFTTILAVCGMYMATAQAPDIEWQKALGGSSVDVSSHGQQTNDGGYIVAGTSISTDGDVTENHGLEDGWIVKLNSSGVLQWQTSLGTATNNYIQAIYQTADNGYIIAGQVGGTGNFWIVKIDESGNIEWEKSFGGTGGERAMDIQQTTDGGYIAVGFTYSTDGDVTGNHGGIDYWMVKLDSIGNLQWQKCLGGTKQDWANSVRQTPDGGYIVAGFSLSNDGDVTGHHGIAGVQADYWIVKTDDLGNIQWQKSLGGTGEDQAFSVRLTSDGGYVVAGFSRSTDGDVSGNHGGGDFWIVKLNSSGAIQWQKALGGSMTEQASSIEQTVDGGYIIAGYTLSNNGDVSGNHGGRDFWVVKLNGSGTLQWQKALGGTEEDNAYSVQQTTDGGYFIVGSTTSNNGDVNGHHGNADYWVVKLAPDNMSVTDSQLSQLEIYPNPAKDVVHFSKAIDGELYNATGQKVMSIKNAKSVNVSGLAKGVYMLITTEGIMKKIIRN